jgi:hypothetical protein
MPFIFEVWWIALRRTNANPPFTKHCFVNEREPSSAARMWRRHGSLAMMASVDDLAAPDEGAHRRNRNK